MSVIHADLADGRWEKFTIVEQLAHIGSEISRARRALEAGNRPRMIKAVERALDLFDLTMAHGQHRGLRLREICRAREVVCDCFLGDNVYGSTPESLDRYFAVHARAAVLGRGR